MYTIEMAKNDMAKGWIEYRIVRHGKAWAIQFAQPGSDWLLTRYLTTNRSLEPRTFKTLDAAVATIEKIGWTVDELRPE